MVALFRPMHVLYGYMERVGSRDIDSLGWDFRPQAPDISLVACSTHGTNVLFVVFSEGRRSLIRGIEKSRSCAQPAGLTPRS